jgi:hypothetical protein
MVDPKTSILLKEITKELKLDKEWVINLVQVEDNTLFQLKEDRGDFTVVDAYAITYILPRSKIAEIYLFPNKDDIRALLVHELLHIKLSEGIYQAIVDIELNSNLSSVEARKRHNELRIEEHRVIDYLSKQYLLNNS